MDSCQVKIYTRTNGPRLKYIAGILLGDILGLTWEIITDKRKVGQHPVINYSSENIRNSFKIDPVSLLSENGIRNVETLITYWKDLPVFFQTPTPCDLPFDIFAASFYLVSRYEEYLEYQPDEYGRFSASSSLAYQNGFLMSPVIDLWTKQFAREIIKKYPALAIRRNEYKALLTVDTDQPFAFLGKPLLRHVGGMIYDLTLNTGKAAYRYKVVTHEERDPYEVYDYLAEKINGSRSDVKFFFPVGDKSKYDTNPSWKNKDYRELINRVSAEFNIGLHPSFYASDNFSMLATELDRLTRTSGKEIITSRFHFIRMSAPTSYRHLLKAGITEDYSMGFPDEPGFRAGIARPYMFYDVSEDKQTTLKVVPFQVMDWTLYQYKKLDAGSSEPVINELIDVTRRVGGQFVSLWHNTTLQATQEWKPWRDLFEKTVLREQ